MNDEVHISTKDKIGDYDAIESAKPGEPLFPIQGGDPLGPPTVQFWADSARRMAHDIMDGKRAGFEPEHERDEYQPTEADKRDAEKLLRKATNAEQVKWEMQAYQRGDVELTGSGRATYNDQPEFLTEEAEDRATKRRARIKMAERLRYALGEAHGVAEGLAKIQELPEQEVAIREAIEALKAAAAEVEPRRGMERS
jgi:hypothetical protein